jgi:hypothetical protein
MAPDAPSPMRLRIRNSFRAEMNPKLTLVLGTGERIRALVDAVEKRFSP